MFKNEIAKQLQRVCFELWPQLKDGLAEDFFIDNIELTKDNKYGDVSSTIAMQLAKKVSANPLEIADKIIDSTSKNFQNNFSRIEAAVPGFINFTFSKSLLNQQVSRIIELDHSYGRSNYGKGKRVQVEFISANPTGPLHLGNGRGAFMGDVLASIISSQGYTIRREYYINNIGHQVEVLAESVIRRYLQQTELKVDYPSRCYQGKYVIELADKLKLQDIKLKDINRIKKQVKEKVLKLMITQIRDVVEKKLGIKFHQWFYESDLYKKGIVKEVLALLKEKNLIYKSEGATWLKTSAYGDEKDRVIIKANREYTYFVSDIAYHWNKFVQRRFDRVIDFWGADHQGHVIRMHAMKKALEMPGQLDLVVVQLVRLISQNQEIRMSKRSGTFVTLEEVVDEVGLDVARFFFLMRSADTHMDFDLDLAKERSDKNPVYYVQYAHARICSIMNKRELKKVSKKQKQAGRYDHRAEVDLIKELVRLPDLLADICEDYEIQRLPFYTVKLAELFHNFYTQCRVIDDGKVNLDRVALIRATRIVLRNCLKLMKVNAPVKM